MGRRKSEEDQARRKTDGALQTQQPSQEELLRQEVLAELDRSQMPAVQKENGRLEKTIEHYTFADSLEVATISIEFDKDLFDGAGVLVSEELIEVIAREDNVTILLRGLPVSSGKEAVLADWRLYLYPLFHTVDATATSWKLRKGKLSVRL